MHLSWEKELTASEALRPNIGSLMSFLRLTKAGMPHDHTTWFRYVLFSAIAWVPLGNGREVADVPFHVTILGNGHGLRNMRLDFDPSRAENHSAPTVHLIYDNFMRSRLLANDLTGHVVRLTRDFDVYRLDIL